MGDGGTPRNDLKGNFYRRRKNCYRDLVIYLNILFINIHFSFATHLLKYIFGEFYLILSQNELNMIICRTSA